MLVWYIIKRNLTRSFYNKKQHLEHGSQLGGQLRYRLYEGIAFVKRTVFPTSETVIFHFTGFRYFINEDCVYISTSMGPKFFRPKFSKWTADTYVHH